MPEPNASLPPMFSAPSDRTEKGISRATLGIVGAVVLALLLGLVLVSSRHKMPDPSAPMAAASYAANLPLSGLAMSESTSLSGGKSTFIDGHVRNAGTATVTGVTVQVFFKGDEGMPPHVETVPLQLIRTREPYVDTQPVSAAPLGPGEEREFRLIFEAIPDNWNQQVPEIRVVRVQEK